MKSAKIYKAENGFIVVKYSDKYAPSQRIFSTIDDAFNYIAQYLDGDD